MEFRVRRSTVVDEDGLWHVYGQRIYRYLLRLTGERETAEDLTQETFLQAIRDLRRLTQPPANEAAWFFRIAANRATDLFRRRQRIAWTPFTLERHGGISGASPPRRSLQCSDRATTPYASGLRGRERRFGSSMYESEANKHDVYI